MGPTAAWEVDSPAQQTSRPVETALRVFLGLSSDIDLALPQQGAAKSASPVMIAPNFSRRMRDHLTSQGYKHFHRFAVLPSRAKPRWILPYATERGGVCGFQLYRPYSTLLKVAKAVVTGASAMGFRGWIRDSLVLASRNELAVERLAAEITGEKRFLFALSLGTAGTFQKLTIQAMRGDGRTLGYMKMPMTEAALQRLRQEEGIMRKLQSFRSLSSHVPALLFAGFWKGTYVLFQSPVEGATGPVRFTGMHEDFLQKLHNCQVAWVPGKVLIERTAHKWESSPLSREAAWQALGREILNVTWRELADSIVRCGIHHGDFAPWNTRVRGRQLCVFDWESASCGLPALWDRFHFIAQTECVLKENQRGGDGGDIRALHRSLYLTYLLSSAADAAEEHARQFAIDYRKREAIRFLAAQSA